MRSFLECLPCWGTMTHEVPMTEEVVAVAATPVREKETKSLMPPDTAAATRRKMNSVRVRVSVGSTGSMNSSWKPSLCSITEDNAVVENKGKTLSETTRMTTAVDTVAKRKSSPRSRSNVHVRSYGNDTRRSSVPVFLPTFSPTAFMF